jgi:hypothetical protein
VTAVRRRRNEIASLCRVAQPAPSLPQSCVVIRLGEPEPSPS